MTTTELSSRKSAGGHVSATSLGLIPFANFKSTLRTIRLSTDALPAGSSMPSPRVARTTFTDRPSTICATKGSGPQSPRLSGVPINGGAGLIPLKPRQAATVRRHRWWSNSQRSCVLLFQLRPAERNFPGIASTADPLFFTTVNRGTTGAGLKAPNRQLTDAQIDATVAFLTSLTETARRGDQTILLPKLEWRINQQNTSPDPTTGCAGNRRRHANQSHRKFWSSELWRRLRQR